MRGTLHLEAQRVSIVLIKYHEGLFRQNRTVGRVAGQRINEEIAPQESNECCAVNNNTCPLGCFSPTFAFLFSSSHSVCVLCDLIHPHCIDVDEIMISKIYIFNLDLASEFQPHTSSVNWLFPSGWPQQPQTVHIHNWIHSLSPQASSFSSLIRNFKIISDSFHSPSSSRPRPCNLVSKPKLYWFVPFNCLYDVCLFSPFQFHS